MQIKRLRFKSYRSWALNDSAGAEALMRLKQLELYDKLRGEGCLSRVIQNSPVAVIENSPYMVRPGLQE